MLRLSRRGSVDRLPDFPWPPFLTVRTGAVTVPSSPDGHAIVHAEDLEQTHTEHAHRVRRDDKRSHDDCTNHEHLESWGSREQEADRRSQLVTRGAGPQAQPDQR